MCIISTNMSKYFICKPFSSSCIWHAGEQWFPVDVDITFAELKEMPTWIVQVECAVGRVSIPGDYLCTIGVFGVRVGGWAFMVMCVARVCAVCVHVVVCVELCILWWLCVSCVSPVYVLCLIRVECCLCRIMIV